MKDYEGGWQKYTRQLCKYRYKNNLHDQEWAKLKPKQSRNKLNKLAKSYSVYIKTLIYYFKKFKKICLLTEGYILGKGQNYGVTEGTFLLRERAT